MNDFPIRVSGFKRPAEISTVFPARILSFEILFVTLRTTKLFMGKTKDYTDEQERIARYAKAMGHPARMAILQFLAGRETCFFGDIHEELPIAKATVSQHLKE